MLLDVSAYELRRHERIVRMERRPMELLILLVERQGELVTRDAIADRLWGRDVFVDIDASVNTVIRKVRRALRDSADAPRFIQTVQGKGYRFVAKVDPVGAAPVLAVLPFENLLSGADQNYVADGLTEETIAGLGRIDPDRLSVIGRTSSMTYRGTTKPIADSSGRRTSNLAAMHTHSMPWPRPRGCRGATRSLFRSRATRSRPWGASAKRSRSSSRLSAVHRNTTCRRTRWRWCTPG
jgi:Transcriptional regulatory protein, C terminal